MRKSIKLRQSKKSQIPSSQGDDRTVRSCFGITCAIKAKQRLLLGNVMLPNWDHPAVAYSDQSSLVLFQLDTGFSGFGCFRRICLSDNLLPLLPERGRSPTQRRSLGCLRHGETHRQMWNPFKGRKSETYVRVSWANHFCQGEILALVAQKIGHHHLYHLHIQLLLCSGSTCVHEWVCKACKPWETKGWRQNDVQILRLTVARSFSFQHANVIQRPSLVSWQW